MSNFIVAILMIQEARCGGLNTYNPNIWEMEVEGFGVQYYLYLCVMLETLLDYVTACLLNRLSVC